MEPLALLAVIEETLTFSAMLSVGYTYWKDGSVWVGQLDEFPDYQTQGTDLDDLREHLIDLYRDLSSDAIPGVRHHGQLSVA